jgi:hypothetical protein
MPLEDLVESNEGPFSRTPELTIEELPVIAHVDKFVCRIATTPSNVDFLENRPLNFFGCLSTNPYWSENMRPTKLQKGQGAVALIIDEPISKITIFPHKQLAETFLEQNLFPTRMEMCNSGFHGRWLATIVINAKHKTHYRQHLQNILEALEILEQWLELTPSILEISFDARDPIRGDFLRKKACLRWPPSDRQLFHSVGKKKRLGPSPDANNEYHGLRAKSMTDRRSDRERPQGGSRQIYSYDRTVQVTRSHEGMFFRFELRLFRKYLSVFTRKNRITACRDLLNAIELIARHNIIFMELDLVKLNRDHPQTRRLRLQHLSTKGQLYRLRERGYSDNLLGRYQRTLPWPNTLFITDPFQDLTSDNSGLALWIDVPYD